MRNPSRYLVGAVLALGTSLPACAGAATIIDSWAQVRVPAPPELKPATVDPGSTALLLLDFNGGDTAASGPCNRATKPRCLASTPVVRALLDRARAARMMVVYSLSATGQVADIQPNLQPRPGEQVVASEPDKFVNTTLSSLLAGRGIKTLILTGTAAEGAVLATGTDAALHGFNLVVPVDALSSTEAYAEQYVAWHFTHAPGVAPVTVLTRSDLIAF